VRRGQRRALAGRLVVAAALLGVAASAVWQLSEKESALRRAALEQARATLQGTDGGARGKAITLLAEHGWDGTDAESRPILRRAMGRAGLEELDFWEVFSGTRKDAICTSASGRWVMFSSEEGDLEIHDVEARRRVGGISGLGQRLMMPVVSACGDWGAVRLADGELVVFAVASGSVLWRRPEQRVTSCRDSVVFEGEEMWVLRQAAGVVERLETRTGKVLRTWNLGGSLAQVVATEDGCLVTGNGGLWQVHGEGREKRLAALSGEITSLAWNPVARVAVMGRQDGALVWVDVPTGRVWGEQTHASRVGRVAFSPCGEWLASTSWDGSTAFSDAWGRRMWLREHGGLLARWREDGTVLFFRSAVGFGLWRFDAPEGYRILRGHGAPAGESSGLAYDSGSGLLAVTDRRELRIWNENTGRLDFRATLEGARGCAWQDGILFVAAADGVWTWEETRGLEKSGGGLAMGALAAAPDVVYAAGEDGIWEKRGRSAWSHKRGFPMLGNETRLSAAHDGTLAASLWKNGGTLLLRGWRWLRLSGHKGGTVALSPAGDSLLTGDHNAYRLWRKTDGGWREVAEAHQGQGGDFPGAAVFSADGSRVAVLWRQAEVHLLSVPGLERLDRFVPDGGGVLFQLSADEHFETIHAGDGLGKTHIWSIKPARERLETPPGWSLTRGPLPWLILAAVFIGLVVAVWLTLREHRLILLYARGESELREQAEKLRALERMDALGRLSLGVAHDFRNLLSVIRMRVGLLRQGRGNLTSDGEAIECAISKADGVVRSLLNVGGAGGDLIGEGVDVREELRALLPLLAGGGGGEDGTFSLEAPDGTGFRANMTSSEFHQVVLNLVWNAGDAGNEVRVSLVKDPPSGSPILAAGPCCGWLVVEDSGPGIAEEERFRIFEPFQTRAAMGRARGKGLGLSTVLGICRNRRAGIVVGRSERLGGACIAISLPVP
jgi:signal transduction histidine kinase/WD40 repeat protein